MEIGGALGMAVFLAVFVKTALDKMAAIVRAKWPTADLALPFGIVAILGGGLLAWFAQVNVFAPLGLDPQLERVLSAIAVGLGVEFINDLTAIAQGRRSMLDDLVETEVEVVGEPRSLGWQPDDAEPGMPPAHSATMTKYVTVLGPQVRGW